MYYERSTDSAVFEVWFEGRLMPLLSPGDVVIMDNAQFHRKEELRKIASRHHVLILFLPPYSPDYNPIEKMWANLKRCSERICAATIPLRTLLKPLLINILKLDDYIP